MLDFLSSIVLVREVTTTNTERTSRKQEVNPANGADLRLFMDGRVYPSAELVSSCNLEYTAKDAQKGLGFDIFPTDVWNEFPKNAPRHVVLISPVSKSLSKVSLFDMTRYNEDGTPISSVVTQGPNTFGKELIVMLERIYNPVPEGADESTHPTIFNERNFVDLKIMRNIPVTSADNIYNIPKVVKKGVDKGSIEHIRRENLELRPLVIYTPEMEAEWIEAQNSKGTDVVSE